MEQKFYNVVVSCNSYFELENGGEKLTINEAHEFIKKMQGYFPDNEYRIEAYVLVDDPYYIEERTYSRYAADGWEDLYSTDEG